VTRLTRTSEAGEFNPWKMGDFTAESIDGMLKVIVPCDLKNRPSTLQQRGAIAQKSGNCKLLMSPVY
jgi:hypothetical protein